MRRRNNFVLFGRTLPSHANDPPKTARPDWADADPAYIDAATARAIAQPSGGWAVLDASRKITRAPRRFEVAGLTLVAWRAPDGPRVGPEACPHMGASLVGARVDSDGCVVCPWHGLKLGRRSHGAWRPLAAHDDGVLTWVRTHRLLADGEAPSDRPIVPSRPTRFIAGVIRATARCTPAEILANRLDPWHGTHFHPHAFVRLRVLEKSLEAITVRVAYRVAGPFAMEVDARFCAPDPRTVVMTIVEGDGLGSVVETHATPISADRTAVIEATLVTSDRVGFDLVRRAGVLVRPFIERRAARLWQEDVEYAERRFSQRASRGSSQTRQRRGSDAMKPRGGIE